MKIAGIILIVLQVLALQGACITGSMADANIFQSIGFSLFGIIGVILLILSRKKTKSGAEHNLEKELQNAVAKTKEMTKSLYLKYGYNISDDELNEYVDFCSKNPKDKCFEAFLKNIPSFVPSNEGFRNNLSNMFQSLSSTLCKSPELRSDTIQLFNDTVLPQITNSNVEELYNSQKDGYTGKPHLYRFNYESAALGFITDFLQQLKNKYGVVADESLKEAYSYANSCGYELKPDQIMSINERKNDEPDITSSTSRRIILFLAALLAMEEDSTIAACKNYKPLTSALLFIIIDYLNGRRISEIERKDEAKEIFTFVEDTYLTTSELATFDLVLKKMGKILNGELQPRGEWTFCTESDNWLYKLYVFYVDCLIHPSYITDYENAPLEIINLTKNVDCYAHFESYFRVLNAFGSEVYNSYKQEADKVSD